MFFLWLNGVRNILLLSKEQLWKLRKLENSIEIIYGAPFGTGRLGNFICNHWYSMPVQQAIETFLSLPQTEQAAMIHGMISVIKQHGDMEKYTFIGTPYALSRFTGVRLYQRGY